MVGWLNMNGTNKLLPFVGMIIAVLAQSGSMVVIKVAMKDGMNKYVMVVYSMALSTILLLPLAFFINRFLLLLLLLLLYFLFFNFL
jgi:hypothetical protein